MTRSVAVEARRIFDLQSEHKWQAKVSSVEERKALLRRLRGEIVARSGDLQAALTADMGKPIGAVHPEEVDNALAPIDDALAHLDEWARPVTIESDLFPDAEETILYEARGVCLLFGPWNFPFQLLFEPLVPIIAAGNTAIMKPNELAPRTSRVSAEIVRAVFDERLVAIFEGGVETADILLELPVDHIFFTGSPAIGRIIMAAAARHLASVTLELGGKCPAIVDGTHDVAEAARTVAAARHNNGGQLCLATDYVWVRADVEAEFLRHYDEWVDEHLYHDEKLDPSAMTHMVNERNLLRVLSYVDDAVARGARLTRGGHRSTVVQDMIEPAVVLDAPLDSTIMTDEIFGPLLPVQTFEEVGEVIDFVRSGTKPLAMYIYSDDREFVDALLRGTSSGGVTVNGFGSHWADSRLPFGGVNHSGIGRYHGVHGFRELSHERSVVRHVAAG